MSRSCFTGRSLTKGHPLHALRDPRVENEFNETLLEHLRPWEYTVLTVTIDKLEHITRYSVWHYHPYHYCLHVLLGRYVLWLARRDARGDVLAESRGGKEDRRLKDSFQKACASGTPYVEAALIADRLASRQLKIKPKTNNIAGLQLADLLAHPSFRASLARRHNQALAENFGGRIAEILEAGKHDRDANGKVEGWGRKWLP